MTRCSCKRRHSKRRGHTRRKRGGGLWDSFTNYWNKCNIQQKIDNKEIIDQSTKNNLFQECCAGYKKYLTPQRPGQCRALTKAAPLTQNVLENGRDTFSSKPSYGQLSPDEYRTSYSSQPSNLPLSNEDMNAANEMLRNEANVPDQNQEIDTRISFSQEGGRKKRRTRRHKKRYYY